MAPPKIIKNKLWTEVDNYFASLLAPGDALLDAVVKANRKAKLPEIDVSPLLGKFLQLMVQITQAKRVLEIGTLGGYSAICMARANLRIAGMLNRVDIRVGKALDTLPALHAEGHGPFDFIFIDADKENNPQYLNWALTLSRPGTVIVVDNVARHGAVIRTKSKEPDIRGTRRMLKMMANHPRLAATALQTVGVKGLDGFAMAVVTR